MPHVDAQQGRARGDGTQRVSRYLVCTVAGSLYKTTRDPNKDWTVSSCGRIMYYSMRPQRKIASQTLQIG